MLIGRRGVESEVNTLDLHFQRGFESKVARDGKSRSDGARGFVKFSRFGSHNN